jgi:hypothetical protein
LGLPPNANRAASMGAEPSTAHTHVGLSPLALPVFGSNPAANWPCFFSFFKDYVSPANPIFGVKSTIPNESGQF